MPGKHRRSSRPAAVVAMIVAPAGLAAAAMAASSMTGVAPTDTPTVAAPSVDLTALVSAANSTSQIFAGSSYYGTDWTKVYGTQQVVPFLAGPQGIADAIASHKNDTKNGQPDPTGVTASGWGAGQTGSALRILATNTDNTDLNNVGLVILDNNSNRAGGGFWTTYRQFAPLLFTSSEPSPNNIPGLTVLDVAYEYNINSDAPVDPLNPFSIGNTLAAYAFGYGAESRTLNITQGAPGGTPVYTDPDEGETDLLPGHHYIVDSAGFIADDVTLPPNPDGSPVTTAYITVDSGNLPLTRVLRLIPGGDILANAVDPTLTKLVDAGYNDDLGTPGNPAIPANPTVPRPMKPFSSLSALDAGGSQESVQDGATAGVQTAISDTVNPSNFITKPIGEAGKLPFISAPPSTLTNSTVTTTNSKKFVPGLNKPVGTTSSTGGDRPRPLKKIADDFNSSLKKFASGLREQKSEDPDNDPE